MILGGKLPGKVGHCRLIWLHGQAVKTPPFHGGNRGSIPRGVTKYAGLAELADALDLGSSGRPWGFKSLIPHHKKAHFIRSVFFFMSVNPFLKDMIVRLVEIVYIIFIGNYEKLNEEK